MAAIGREVALLVLIVMSASAQPASALASSSDARAQVAAVAEALSASDAAEAMTHFSKSLADYDKLRRYFEGLSAFQVENQLEITDEQDSSNDVALTISWDITLTDLGTDESRRRSGEIHAKLALVDNKWRIIEFTPLDIFNPQLH